jgi:glucose/mannose-6-phosphate isomerase
MADETLSIDDLSQQLDSEGMIGFTQSFVSDLERGFSAVDEKHLPWLQQLKSNDWNGVLCFGMGGSAAGGDFLARVADASGSKPFIVHRGYQLPSWWTSDWLILATSHSGNTEETIAATEAALEQGATVVVIATGGVLAGLCELHENCHLIPSIGGQPPRTAFGHLFSRQLALMEHLGLIPQQADDEREAMLVRLEYACQANDFRNASGTPLLDLAMALREHPIALLGPTEMQPALVRCKNQLNENSGRFARIGIVPEMNHNEIVAWGGVSDDADPAREDQAILILTWDGMHARVRRRVDWMIEHTPTDFAWRIHGEGTSLLEVLLHHCIVMDWLTIALALLHGKDPAAIRPIQALKGYLADDASIE